MIHGGEIYDKTIEYDLSVNLNPEPCPEEVRQALKDALEDVSLYPDIMQKDFRRAVAKAENKLLGKDILTMDNIIGGNGASELIMAAIRMIGPREVLLPVPSFYGYMHGAMALGDVNVREYALDKDKGFELTNEFAGEITADTDLVILANPNNPTGRAIDRGVPEEIINRCIETDTWIIIDECFLHLSDAGQSAAGFLKKAKKLIIINAYTKLFSLPGVRVGYAISDGCNIDRLRQFLPEWNMSVFAQRAGKACAEYILDTDFVQKTKKLVRTKKEGLCAFLEQNGTKVFPSDSCFILIQSNEALYESLLAKNILIRDCSNFKGLGRGYFRMSVSGDRIKEQIIKDMT